MSEKIDLTDPRYKVLGDVSQVKLQDFMSQKQSAPDVSALESGVRGGAQGLTFGFADEITGGLESLISDKTYQQARDESRLAYEQARQANPTAFLGGEIAGAVAPMFLTGGGSAIGQGIARTGLIGGKAATTVAGLAGQGALQGGLQAIGENENLSNLPSDVAMGAGIGGLTGGAFGGAGRAVSKIGDVIPSGQAIRKKAEDVIGGFATGLDERGIDVIRKNPDALQRIEKLGEGSTPEVIQGAIIDLSSKLDQNPYIKKVNELTDKAYNVLDKSDARFDVAELANKVDDFIEQNLKVKGTFQSDTELATANKLLQRKDGLLSLADADGKISARDLKSTINSIRKDINFERDAKNFEVQGGLKKFQNILDQKLKEEIPEFRSKMKPLAKAMELKDKLDKRIFDQYGKADLNKVKSLIQGQMSPIPNLNDEKLIQSVQKRIGEVGGAENLSQFVKDARLKKLLEGFSNKGANLAVTGTAVGTGLGSMVGGAVGGFAGAGIGGAVGASIGAGVGKNLETTGRRRTSQYFANRANLPSEQILQKTQGTKYGQVLKNALNRGSREFE